MHYSDGSLERIAEKYLRNLNVDCYYVSLQSNHCKGDRLTQNYVARIRHRTLGRVRATTILAAH